MLPVYIEKLFSVVCISWYFRNVVNENILQSKVLHTNLDLPVQKRNSYIKSNLRRVFKVIVATAKLKLNLFRKLFFKVHFTFISNMLCLSEALREETDLLIV